MSGGVDTGGGAHFGGDVHAGGDVIGRDQIQGDQIVLGDHAALQKIVFEGVQYFVTVVDHSFSKDREQAEGLKSEDEQLGEALKRYALRLEEQVTGTERFETRPNPYKHLDPYEIQDAAYFYGREAALEGFLPVLNRRNLSVLISESGAGKTSFLKAKIMPVLLSEKHYPVYLRPFEDPVADHIKSTLLPGVGQLETLGRAPLRDFLHRATTLLNGRRIFLLLDQFEEFFTHQNESDREAFILELIRCLDDPTLPVSWVFSLRKEYFGEFGFLSGIPNPSSNSFPLKLLTREEAREVIIKPAEREGVHFEESLVDRLLDDLGNDVIAPPQLQLVCSRLYELKGGSLITGQLYESNGGAKGILRSYLDDVIREFPGRQRHLVLSILRSLITSDKTRTLKSEDEILLELRPLNTTPEELNQILYRLRQRRILRAQERDDYGSELQLTYELAHDYLIDRIELDPETVKIKAAQELISVKLPYYHRDRLLLSKEELNLIDPVSKKLTLDHHAQLLIRQSRDARDKKSIRDFVMRIAAVVGVPILLISVVIFIFNNVRFAEISVGLGSLFWVGVFATGLVGASRGWAKEILVTISAVLAIYLTNVLVPLLLSLFDVPETGSQTAFWAKAIPLFLFIYFGYQTPRMSVQMPRSAGRRSLQDRLVGLLSGMVNGYLIFGSVIYFIHDAGYPFPAFPAPTPDGPEAQLLTQLVSYLAPAWLTGGVGFAAVAVVFLFVLVVFI